MSTGHTGGWKVLAAGMAVIAGLCLGASARGVEIRNVTAKQRYPWNGLVDIRFTVEGIEEGLNWLLVVEAVEPDTGEVHDLSHFRIVREGTDSDDRMVDADGEYELLWDAQADLGEIVCSNMVVQVTFDAHPLVRLWEDGPYWADRNVGAEEPSDYGFHFWWGDPVGYYWENDQWVASDGSASGFSFTNTLPTYMKNNSKLLSDGWITTNSVLAPEHDPAQAQWGRGWRMPTEQELRALCSNCDRSWLTTNGVKGYLLRGRGDYASASIFIPAAGWGNGAKWERVTGNGHIWASDPCQERVNQSWRLNFDSARLYVDYHYDRFIGASCRPVRGGNRE